MAFVCCSASFREKLCSIPGIPSLPVLVDTRERTTGTYNRHWVWASAMVGWRKWAQHYFLCYIESSGSGHKNGTCKISHKCESVEEFVGRQ